MAGGTIYCYSCGTAIPVIGIVGRRDECPKCHADLHVCRNCLHYDPKSYNECRETSADVVREKDRANFCDFFSPGRPGESGNRDKDLKAAAEALFKKKT
jgi:hypothetical protein